MDYVKVISLLALLHEENKQLMSMILSMRCLPKDFDSLNEKACKQWDIAYGKIMRMEDGSGVSETKTDS